MILQAHPLIQTMSVLLKELFQLLRRHWVAGLVAGLCVAGVVVRLAPIAASRFHQDEAIYAHWALKIVTGQDPWLSHCVVDKPPLHLYCLAVFMHLFGHSETVARLPGELFSAASLLLFFFFGKRLYNQRVALVCLALAAFSPFNILFAPTAFTDPMMVAGVLGSLLAVSHGRWGLSGWLLGLGFITKPLAILFFPLIAAVGAVGWDRPSKSAQHGKPGLPLLRFAALFSLALVAAIVWDMMRAGPNGFLEQSLVSYGGLRWATVASWPERLQEWSRYLGYFTGSRLLNLILIVGLPFPLGHAGLRWRTERSARLDWMCALFVAGFILIHTLLDFNIWDRYLLGLVPIVLLLLARVLLMPLDLWQTYSGLVCRRLSPILCDGGDSHGCDTNPHTDRARPFAGDRGKYLHFLYGMGLTALLLSTLLRPVQDAASSRYSIGGAYGAYNGIDALVGYIRGNVPGGAVIYHHWLGWHYSFYLFDFPYLFQWYATAEELTEDASHRPGVPKYVAFPSWRSATTYRWALKQAGFNTSPVYEAYREDGTRSFTLYRIEDNTPDG